MFSGVNLRTNQIIKKFVDELRFSRAWFQNPLKTGAVTPSGPDLAHKIASYIPICPQTKMQTRVLELGPGTGPVTEALIERGIEQQNLTLLEYSPTFLKNLRKRYPDADVVHGDAFHLKTSLPAIKQGSLDAVVSCLPLLSQPTERRLSCLFQAFELLKPGAPFIQFSYSLSSPIARNSKAFTTKHSSWIMRNFPPARVWIYTKTENT
ncbi:class I SAM-dependent methyltransferase [Polycladidibacter stylochi]|uniref:class I SAM-dependent methyltransferase n=1 Tax=Polycladidibacter stylochi TaxID=1807766 RepID=UPI00082BE4B0|nr:methyltransferase domain-containing protein [Pseudovibrio stylochi]